MALSTANLILLFMPWACLASLGHLAKRDFRAHLRRRHPLAYQRVYGVYADRSRHSALNPVVWLLQLRFEMSHAWRVFGDARLEYLGERLRRRTVATLVLYFGAIGWVLGAV